MSWYSATKKRISQTDQSQSAIRKTAGAWTFVLLLAASIAFMKLRLIITLALVAMIVVITMLALVRPQWLRWLMLGSFWGLLAAGAVGSWLGSLLRRIICQPLADLCLKWTLRKAKQTRPSTSSTQNEPPL